MFAGKLFTAAGISIFTLSALGNAQALTTSVFQINRLINLGMPMLCLTASTVYLTTSLLLHRAHHIIWCCHCLAGIDNEFLFTGRLDNLGMSYCCLAALLDSYPTEGHLADESAVKAIALFDHEEVGSASAQGARP